jgi:hypothetical protein
MSQEPPESSVVDSPSVAESCPFELSPTARAFDNPTGIAVILGDGKEWLLAECGLAEGLAAFRNKIYDDSALTSQVRWADLYGAAYYALMVNYRLSDAEAKWLIHNADPDTVGEATCKAIVPLRVYRRTFDDWALGTLYANGLRPDEIPAHRLPHVFEILVKTGRAVHPEEYVDSGVAAAKIGGFRSLMQPKSEVAVNPLLKTE